MGWEDQEVIAGKSTAATQEVFFCSISKVKIWHFFSVVILVGEVT